MEYDFLFDKTIYYRWLDEEHDKQLLKRYVDFMYDFYVMQQQLSINSDNIRASLPYTLDFATYSTYLLDDLPGMVVKGDEFANCTFPNYPGRGGGSITDDELNGMLYSKWVAN